MPLVVILSFTAVLNAQRMPAAAIFEDQPVIAVDLIARPTLHTEMLRHLVVQQAGQPYSTQKIAESVSALKATGQFTGIETNVIPEQGGLRLELIMDPVFYIGTFEFPEAARTFNYVQLLGVLRYPSDEPYEKSRVDQAVPALQHFFNENGYFSATVRTETQLDERQQLATVIYRVALGQKARFGTIEIGGLPPELAAHLQTTLQSFRARLHGANLKPGKPYDPERLRAAQRFLRDYLGKRNYLASEVKLEPPQYDPRTNRANLHFDATLGPVVMVRASGAHVSDRTLRKQVPIYSEKAVDQDLIDIGARNLTSYFQDRGYFDAKITPEMKTDGGSSTLTYMIDRGDRLDVAHVTLRGNHQFNQHEVSDQILVKRAHFLARGKFSEELVHKTKANLEAYWRNAGYENVNVVPRVADRGTGVDVTFEIAEGVRTIVDSFQLQGNQNQEVLKLVQRNLLIKPGEPYSPSRASQDRNRILASYLDFGYLNATLRVEATPVSGNQHRVSVKYRIDEGPHLHVSQVVYTGQRRSHVSLLQQAVNIRTDTDMSESNLLQAESNLYNLGVFDWTDVSPRRPITDQTNEDVLVKVHEAKRNSISYGIGFQSTPRSGSLSTGILVLPGLPTVGLPQNFTILEKTIISPLASISYSRLNMRGRAETLSVSALVSSLDQKLNATYSVPHFRGTQWSALFTASGENTTQNPLFAAQLGQGSFQFERNLDAAKTRKLQLRYTFQHTNLNHLLIENFVPTDDLATHLSTLSATFVRDTRDKELDAHKGLYQTLDFQLSPIALGSSDNVARLFGQQAYYWQATPWLVFANSVRLGLASSFAGSHVPFSDRFFSGGADSLRGFPLNGAGPQATALLCTAQNNPSSCTAQVTVPDGGLQLLIFNSELRFPLPVKKGLGGVLFYDGGNVYHSINLPGLVRNYSNSVGIGLRYQTPVGPVRIDVGRSLNPVSGLSSTQVFVTLGQAF
jgi:outer membrane protein assembly factor BamA